MTTAVREKPRLQKKYEEEVVPHLMKKFGYKNRMAVPRIVKITVSMGVGDAKNNPEVLEAAIQTLMYATGQRPAVAYARRAIAGFGLKKGQPIGVFVTLRKRRMWYFLDRLIQIVLPRVRDFRGLPVSAMDGRGNYNIGLREQSVFPEVPFEIIDRPRGMNIAIHTTAETDEEAIELLRGIGLPLKEEL